MSHWIRCDFHHRVPILTSTFVYSQNIQCLNSHWLSCILVMNETKWFLTEHLVMIEMGVIITFKIFSLTWTDSSFPKLLKICPCSIHLYITNLLMSFEWEKSFLHTGQSFPWFSLVLTNLYLTCPYGRIKTNSKTSFSLIFHFLPNASIPNKTYKMNILLRHN